MNGEPLYDPATIQLETSLGYYLAKARNVLVMRTDQALKPLELTSPQIGVILLLASGRARTPLELSRELSYDSGSMTRMLDRLEEKDFIQRTRSSSDRRVVEVALTSKGRQLADQMTQVVVDTLNHHLRGFTETEVEQFKDFLRRMIANA